jgi:hypothetical protein
MSIFKKVRKGIKKVAKGIGKRIKKVVKKVGRAFGKLGIVGQLGLMFLMPYAMGGLSSFFGQFAAGQAGTFASNLVAQGGIKGAIGQAMGAIHSAGSAVGSIYNNVTEAISKGFDRAGNFLKGRGFTVTPTPDAVPIPSAAEVVTDEVKEETLLGKGKKKIVETFEGVKETLTDPEKLTEEISEGALSGLKAGAKDIVVGAISGEQPDNRMLVANYDIQSMQNYDNGGVMGTKTFFDMNNTYQAGGSVFGAGSSVANAYMVEAVSGGDTNYINDMRMLRGL